MTTVINGPWGTGAGTHLTISYGARSQIGFDNWDTALGAAIVTAKTMRHVKVNKVGSEWVVSWQTPVTYNPAAPIPGPQYPSYPYPTWTSHTNGETA